MQLFLHSSKFCSIFVPEFYKRTIMRNTIDRILRMSIKLCLLTGVAFAFAACYGPAPTRYEEDPAFVEDQEQVDEVLQKEAEEPPKN